MILANSKQSEQWGGGWGGVLVLPNVYSLHMNMLLRGLFKKNPPIVVG